MNDDRSGRSTRSHRHRHDQAGMSLVEVLVAILLLGVILSASASSLIQFSRTAADNERRVQATALLNRLHEELQALPWTDAVLYDEELADLLDAYEAETEGGEWTGTSALDDLEFDGTAWYFEGEEVVVLPGPGTDGRRSGVPVPTEVEDIVVDGRSYEVVRLITWNQRDPQVKRFTTIVRWRLYNRVYEERFFSLRAATASEAGDPERPRVVQFHVGPSPMLLEDVSASEPAQNSEDIQILVRFSQGVSGATLRYPSVEVDAGGNLELVERTLTLARYIPAAGGLHVGFYGTLPAGTVTFPNGTLPFYVDGVLNADTFTGQTAMAFLGGTIAPEDVGLDPGDGPDPDAEPDVDLGPIHIDSVTFAPTTVCTDVQGNLVEAVTVNAFIRGLEPATARVTITYSADGVGGSESFEASAPETFGPDGANFRLVLEAGSDHGFVPKILSGNSEQQSRDETAFTVTASRTVGDTVAALSTAPTTLTVLGHLNSSCT
ncbi:MAG: type IV pilus modification PilV family protein [Nitriliruptoraceae bacterium]